MSDWRQRKGGERDGEGRGEGCGEGKKTGGWGKGERKCVRKREGRQRVGMEGERECAVEGREGDEEGEGIIK